jgi:hypothetical protein
MQRTETASFDPVDAGSGCQVSASAFFEWNDQSLTNRSMTMKAVRYATIRLAWSVTLTTAALLLAPSMAQAGQGHGGHGVWGGSGHSLHHGHHGLLAGFGGTWVGPYPFWGYDSFYGGYPGYASYYGGNGAADFYFGGWTPSWGAWPFGQSTTSDPKSSLGAIRF